MAQTTAGSVLPQQSIIKKMIHTHANRLICEKQLLSWGPFFSSMFRLCQVDKEKKNYDKGRKIHFSFMISDGFYSLWQGKAWGRGLRCGRSMGQKLATWWIRKSSANRIWGLDTCLKALPPMTKLCHLGPISRSSQNLPQQPYQLETKHCKQSMGNIAGKRDSRSPFLGSICFLGTILN